MQQQAGRDAVEGGIPRLDQVLRLGDVFRIDVAVGVEEGDAEKLLEEAEFLAVHHRPAAPGRVALDPGPAIQDVGDGIAQRRAIAHGHLHEVLDHDQQGRVVGHRRLQASQLAIAVQLRQGCCGGTWRVIAKILRIGLAVAEIDCGDLVRGAVGHGDARNGIDRIAGERLADALVAEVDALDADGGKREQLIGLGYAVAVGVFPDLQLAITGIGAVDGPIAVGIQSRKFRKTCYQANLIIQ